jgi:outer membrane protein TolC
VDVGTLPPIEVTTAEAEVASREEQVIVAETNLGNAMDILRQLIGVPETSADWDEAIVPTDRPGFSPIDVDLDSAILRAYDSRPDIRQAELAIRNAQLSERFFENQARPDLVASGTYASTGNNFDFVAAEPTIPGAPPEFRRIDQSSADAFQEIPDLDNTFWSIQLQLVVPLGNRDARARLRRAKVIAEQERLALESLKLQAKVEVRNAVRGLVSASRRVASARANLALQRKKVDAEQKRYENGLSTAFQVLEFQNDLREAEQSEIAAIIDYNNAEVSLLRAQGILLEERGVTLPTMDEE